LLKFTGEEELLGILGFTEKERGEHKGFFGGIPMVVGRSSRGGWAVLARGRMEMKGGDNCDNLGAFGGGLPMAMAVEGGDIPVRETRRVGDVEGDGVEEEGVRLMC
ncbi:hypothetical protein HAX54_004966, partial [Datura stramonium]|nr:hypothetical protein [Datura stramonium]